MLKPHIDLYGDSAQYWRGSIGVQCTSGQWSKDRCILFWRRWFISYSRFLLHYAKLAAAMGVEQLSLSCELVNVSPQEAEWRQLIKRVRQAYRGTLTDAANWGYLNATGGEVFNKTWWDAVDVIGVDAYWPIRGETLEAKVEAWRPIVARLGALSRQWRKPVLFTEIGYCARNCTGANMGPTPTRADLEWQAESYQAAFAALSKNSWWRGLYWWAWNTDPAGADTPACITPQGKPAEELLHRLYRGKAPWVPPPKTPAICACTV